MVEVLEVSTFISGCAYFCGIDMKLNNNARLSVKNSIQYRVYNSKVTTYYITANETYV